MIERRPAAAAAEEYDLVVIGGGIHGACLSLEAARRGWRTLLLERDDFGGATSWNSLRILHGGLRYLQRADLVRYRESVNERRWFLRHFPEQVAPLRCLMPLYGEGLRRPAVLTAALALDDLLSRDRNRGVPAELHLEAGRTLGPAEAVELFPPAASAELRGAALWSDAFMPCAPRVLIEILRWAAACGARALNYCEATGLSVDRGAVTGVTARDRETGDAYEIRTRRVANCAGPWSRELSGRLDREVAELFRPALAFNLLLDREPPSDLALAVSPPGRKQSYFLVPWRDHLMAGTCHAPAAPGRGAPAPDDPDVRAFLADLAAAAPGLDLDRAAVLRVLWGRLPASAGGAATPATRALVHRHADSGGPAGLVSASGVKYTTARALAESTLRALCGGQPPPVGDDARPAAARWPTRDELEDPAADEALLAERLGRLARAESVVHLDDLVLRRTDIGLDPVGAERAVGRIARLLPALAAAGAAP